MKTFIQNKFLKTKVLGFCFLSCAFLLQLQACSVASLVEDIQDEVSTSVSSCEDDLSECENAMLEAVNLIRSEPQDCDTAGEFDAAEPLEWSDELAAAALRHAEDMAENDIFTHEGSDGSTVADRVADAVYVAVYVGENLAYGMDNVAEAMSGWVNSPGHCANIMNPDFEDFGMAFIAETDDNPDLWVQVFAKRVVIE